MHSMLCSTACWLPNVSHEPYEKRLTLRPVGPSLRYCISITGPLFLHPLDQGITELAGLDLLRPLHHAGEVVGDDLVGNGCLQTPFDGVAGLTPAHVAQHHHPGEDNRTRVHLVLPGVLGGGAVGRLEDRMTGVVVDVGSGGD